MTYYIKLIWGPGGPHYPRDDGKIGFSSKNHAERFANCDGFLLYETGHDPKEKLSGGRKTIYARGKIKSKEVREELTHTDKHYWYVEVDLEKRVHPEIGIPLNVIRDILGMKKRSTIQRRGGLLKITEEQFNELSSELEKVK